jgi:uncharacterized membrane protein (DUF373 family)
VDAIPDWKYSAGSNLVSAKLWVRIIAKVPSSTAVTTRVGWWSSRSMSAHLGGVSPLLLLFSGMPVGRRQAVGILDQFLLILLIIELLYTVQVSFREHGLKAEPFLVVALIATIRRVLILTAEVAKLPEQTVFLRTMLELALLTVMILVLVGSLIMLQKQGSATSHCRVVSPV